MALIYILKLGKIKVHFFILYMLFGQSISGDFGVYLFELLAIYITLLYSYKIINLFIKSKALSFASVLYSMTIFMRSNDRGTYSENFALPLITVGLYFGIQYFKNSFEISNLKIIFLGIFTGLIAILRLNMLSIFAGMFLVIRNISYKRKKSKGNYKMD